MIDILDIASATRDPKTNAIIVQAKMSQVGDSENDAPSLDGAPLFNALGVTAMPWPADERGNAQALGFDDLPGTTGAAAIPRDTRVADVVEELGPGETCVHATGPDFGTRIFLKKQLIALVIDDDCMVVLDRENKKFAVNLFGMHLELSAENGFVVNPGGAEYQLKNGIHMLLGQVLLGGRTPVSSVLYTSVPGKPVVGVPSPDPTSGVPAMGVFIGVG
jgi:hypothetical protein